jgi:hypothetical protein
MNDLDICKRIAEIESLHVSKDVKPKCGSAYANIYPNDCYGNYNPLTDDALCFQLMVKYRIDFNHVMFTDDSLHRYRAVNAITGKGLGLNENPNKAICLAIIEANKTPSHLDDKSRSNRSNFNRAYE